MQFILEHHIIPDGISSIVELTIKTEFNVPTEGGVKHAEDAVVEIARRLTGKDEAFIRERIQEQFWLESWSQRPEEAT